MKAIILAGGLGTRLRPLTFAIPKPLIPVGEKPILEILIENLISHGVKDLFLAVGYRAELVQLYFQDGSRFGVRIHYSQEKERLGTAGPVRLARDRFVISEPVLVMNADIITNVNFEDLYGWHQKREPTITVGVRWLEGEIPYGVVEMKGDEVRSIVERPRHSCLINCGIYVVNPEVLDLVPEGEFYMPDLIQAAMGAGHRVCGYEIREKWVSIDDIGDLEDEVNRIDPK
ncbi:MAG: sugar phosphate nucleotidyltransferase [Nitrospinota bacterium]|jgi:NDP-sugar pyrophosphorylase family protein|nr:sugar phosphate nucleotidyltransferase [Nitrospinota bacterium]